MQCCGIGYDVHPLVEGRKCILGGVEIPHPRGLEGHSDADVLIHAIADAILGAIGEGDIGKHFPNSDARWKDAPSRVFLEEIRRMLGARGARLINVDATVIAEAPKVLPHAPAMRAHIAGALGIDASRVNLKATTNEGMGFIGREEGIAAFATASVDVP
ncbi:MAG: 2-C-methyl-D-erythritol 2,4-cyclodiphosphate synthase [Verrucomicrobiae bacterium]|nr:2-C-methyl-D-erythritol 2,4-cyclodiphosphate synthase [Verrucomicrobiae bacterium]